MTLPAYRVRVSVLARTGLKHIDHWFWSNLSDLFTTTRTNELGWMKEKHEQYQRILSLLCMLKTMYSSAIVSPHLPPSIHRRPCTSNNIARERFWYLNGRLSINTVAWDDCDRRPFILFWASKLNHRHSRTHTPLTHSLCHHSPSWMVVLLQTFIL